MVLQAAIIDLILLTTPGQAAASLQHQRQSRLFENAIKIAHLNQGKTCEGK
jgi:hypothetical protein